MFSQEKYQKAIHYAAQAHGLQKYPGKGYTYLVHISLVVMEIIAAITNTKKISNNNINWDLAIECALLHDTIEDTDKTFEDIENEFGSDVANGVSALSKNSKLNKTLQMSDSLNRIKQQPKEIWMVKVADRISNLQKPPSYWSTNRILQYREEAKVICTELKDANEYLTNRLLIKITEYINYV